MVQIEVIQRVPGFERGLARIIPLIPDGLSAPGNVQLGNLIRWTATVDSNEGPLILVTVEHDEALDPEERNVQIMNAPNYIVSSLARTIVQEIIREMSEHHN